MENFPKWLRTKRLRHFKIRKQVPVTQGKDMENFFRKSAVLRKNRDSVPQRKNQTAKISFFVVFVKNFFTEKMENNQKQTAKPFGFPDLRKFFSIRFRRRYDKYPPFFPHGFQSDFHNGCRAAPTGQTIDGKERVNPEFPFAARRFRF